MNNKKSMRYIGYEEWLFENKIQVLKENDINEMEEELKKSFNRKEFYYIKYSF